MHPGRARELEENCAPARRDATCASSTPTRSRCRRELTGFDRALVDAPCSGLGVLAGAARPALARPAAARAPARARCARPPSACKPGGTIVYSVCTLNADENEAVVDASGLEPDDARRRSGRSSAHPKRPEFLLTLPHRHRTSGFFIARLRIVRSRRMSWDDWVRTVEVEPSLYAADFSRLGEQIEVLLRAGARIFHFDVGDGHFVEPVTIGPIVLQSIAPLVHREGGVLDCHLMVDEPEQHFAAVRRGRRRQRHLPLRGVSEPAGVVAQAREHGLQVGLAFNPETERGRGGAAAREAASTSSSA